MHNFWVKEIHLERQRKPCRPCFLSWGSVCPQDCSSLQCSQGMCWKWIWASSPPVLQLSLEQSWGQKLEFCWEELSWRIPIINCSYSPVVLVIQLTEMVRNKPLSHLVFADNQVLLSAPVAPQCSKRWPRAPAHFIREAQFLLSGRASILNWSSSFWICWTLHFNINDWPHFGFFLMLLGSLGQIQDQELHKNTLF